MAGRRDPFSNFGDPFAGFGPFGAFGGPRSLMSSFFGGQDPFDDPFFTRPIGGFFEPNLFGNFGNQFMDPRASGFIEHQPAQASRSRGPIIEELNSDEEKEETQETTRIPEKKENPRKHGRSTLAPCVEEPDDQSEEKRRRQMQYSDFNLTRNTQPLPQPRSYTFQSSTVTYGGANGAYYTSSRTRTGCDGFTFEESKEANSATGEASHQVSRGVHDKGHSVMRKLNSDGRVDTMQTLHNLNEDELAGFEEAWKGKARNHLPGWTEHYGANNLMGAGASAQDGSGRGGWALPSTEVADQPRVVKPDKLALPGSNRSLSFEGYKANGGGKCASVGASSKVAAYKKVNEERRH